MIRILVVCSGNICRSPTAEGVLRQVLDGAGVAARVESAGTNGHPVGDGADPRAAVAASRRGIDLSAHAARRVRRDDFHSFDLILACDNGHLSTLERLRPKNAAARLELLMAYADGSPVGEVPDPYYGDERDFEHALDLIETAAEGFAASLQADR